MYLVLKIFTGQSRKPRHKTQWNFSLVTIPVGLLILCTMVSADHYNWKSSVPSNSYGPVHNPEISSQGRYTQPYQQQYNNHQFHQHEPHFNSAAIAKSASSSTSWYPSHSNDPRMGFLFADSTSAPTPSVQTVVPRPRSLSSLPSLAPSYTISSTNSSNTTNSVRTKSSENKMKTKRKKTKKQKKTSKAIDATTSFTNNAVVHVPPSNTDLDVETSRTFFLTPLLAYLFPVFLAQMFGMGMIPAAALIMMPIFLAPLALGAAVFLI